MLELTGLGFPIFVDDVFVFGVCRIQVNWSCYTSLQRFWFGPPLLGCTDFYLINNIGGREVNDEWSWGCLPSRDSLLQPY